jgi:hypothetical protein
MGRSTDSRGIESFWPDDDKDTLYIEQGCSCSFEYIRERMLEHFGKCMEMEDFTIRGEKIHTDCLGYDLYDPGDYTNFIIIERIKS